MTDQTMRVTLERDDLDGTRDIGRWLAEDSRRNATDDDAPRSPTGRGPA